MIAPTVGRIVWYYEALPGGFNRAELIDQHRETVQPQAAIVAFVDPEGAFINVTRFSREGTPIPQAGVPLVQDDVPVPTHGGWAEWMPYQKGQAAKTESLEAKMKPQPIERDPQDADFARIGRRLPAGAVMGEGTLTGEPEPIADAGRP